MFQPCILFSTLAVKAVIISAYLSACSRRSKQQVYTSKIGVRYKLQLQLQLQLQASIEF
ncbi:hypothetical protein IQ22_03351 [Pseudomonas duriflava]|uniref:Uncharacterized protein n=1 Tax=Pseudomonas duriflava TaxID=459528 RepID=A0A562Q744_9PSED|nr:hypothetical protein IQ22_03351 [Pseudomonas duriflava]